MQYFLILFSVTLISDKRFSTIKVANYIKYVKDFIFIYLNFLFGFCFEFEG